jgi:hypothetical protein
VAGLNSVIVASTASASRIDDGFRRFLLQKLLTRCYRRVWDRTFANWPLFKVSDQNQ